MADRYCRSTSTGAANGTTWADAYTTLAAALAGVSAGDTVWVSQAHAETQESAMTNACPGTASAPCKILCVQDGGGTPAEPPTTLAATATVTVTGDFDMTFTGNAYIHGITFACGTGAVNVNQFWGSGAVAQNIVFSSCTFSIPATGTTSRIYFGGSTRDLYLYFLNCTIKFSQVAQRALLRGHQYWYGGSVDVTTAVPTSIFNTEPAYGCDAVFHGMDFSGCTGTLVIVGNNDLMRYYFKNCRLHASTTAKTATAIIGPGAGQIILDNCASGDTNYGLHHEKFQGTIDIETTIKRTGGASDGTTGFCWKMVGLAAGPQFFWPLESPPIVVWNESTGSAMTATVEFVHDGATNLQDDEIWAEVEYLGTSGYSTGSPGTDRMAGILSTAADQTDSTVEWTTTGLSTPNTQKCVVTFTPQEKGPVVIRVMLAKASQTVYVCPKVTLA